MMISPGLLRVLPIRLVRRIQSPYRALVGSKTYRRACSHVAGDDHPALRSGLYVVGTPIGNLQDLSPRALNILRSVDRIYCEDTRHTSRLCNHFDIRRPLESLHEHNERRKLGQIVERLKSGAAVALVSDAGMPTVSDPGSMLIAEAARADIPVFPIPGPSAFLAAAVASGFDSRRLYFHGFLPSKRQQRLRELEGLQGIPATSVIFVPPHDLVSVLTDACLAIDPERPAVLARELTKVHEEILRGTLGSLRVRFDPGQGGENPRGEFTLVLPPPGKEKHPFGSLLDDGIPLSDEAIRRALLDALHENRSRPAAAAKVAKELGIPRNKAYRLSLEIDISTQEE